ncbi:MAG: periplasmic heavy metal sensor [Alphaproteobacteria bacterium]|nr:periplasmic heavy metal sensor [Alphaproteobacteria bacterium]
MTRMRFLVLALFASLTINLFFGGLTIGHWIERGGPRLGWSWAEAPDGPGPRWLRRTLGEDGMPALRAAWERHGQEADALRDRVHQTRLQVIEALAAEPFDATAYAAALANMRDTRALEHVGMHAVMVDLTQNLTPEQRARLVERSRAWAERRGRRHRQ